MFKNNSITYENFKILSFQYHFWVADIGLTDSDTYHKMEVHKIYDRNGDDVQHTEGSITSYINCKFKRLEPGKHYVQTLSPQYLQRRFTGAVSGGLEMMGVNYGKTYLYINITQYPGGIHIAVMAYYGARGRKRKRIFAFRNRKRQKLLRRKLAYRRKRYYGRRSYYRKKARAGRRLRLSNLYKSVRYTFFRGNIKEIQVKAGRKVVHDIQGILNNVLDIHSEGTAASPTNQQRMFKNNSITYENFKVLSFQYHFWVADIGLTDSDTYHKMEVHKIYDRNGDDVQHTEGSITSYINCKFKRLEPGKHYVQTLRPQYLQRRFTGAVSGGLEMMGVNYGKTYLYRNITQYPGGIHIAVMAYYGARGRKRKRIFAFRNRKRQKLLRRKLAYRRKRYYGRRSYYRKKARAGRRLRLSNSYKSVRYTFFRGNIKEIQVKAGRKVVHDIQGNLNNVLDIHSEGTAASPTNQQRMFKNNSITYENFKVLSFQYHFWVADIGLTDSDTYHKMEVHKIYDRNGDDVQHTEGRRPRFNRGGGPRTEDPVSNIQPITCVNYGKTYLYINITQYPGGIHIAVMAYYGARGRKRKRIFAFRNRKRQKLLRRKLAYRRKRYYGRRSYYRKKARAGRRLRLSNL